MRFACASVLLFFGLLFGQESPSPFQSVPATAPEDTITFVTPLPDFVAKDINGRVWRSADLRGKTTLIDIWSTYCAPCRREHPELQRFYEKAKTTGNVQVLTFSMDHDSTKARAYMSEKKYTFPVIADWTLIRKLFPPEGALPQAWVIDPRGWRSAPFRSWTLGQVLCNLEKTAPTN